MGLKKFEKDLETTLKDKFGQKTRVWVWPEYNGVKGFYGDGTANNAVVIWITERPSSARDKSKLHKFPDWVDKIFYKALKEEGLENMHFTDFVKIMSDAGIPPTEEELDVSAEWMRKEIEMLKVEGKKLIIVANSKTVKEWIEKYLPEYRSIYKEFFKRTIRYNSKENRENLVRKTLKEIYEMTKSPTAPASSALP